MFRALTPSQGRPHCCVTVRGSTPCPSQISCNDKAPRETQPEAAAGVLPVAVAWEHLLQNPLKHTHTRGTAATSGKSCTHSTVTSPRQPDPAVNLLRNSVAGASGYHTRLRLPVLVLLTTRRTHGALGLHCWTLLLTTARTTLLAHRTRAGGGG